MKTSTEINDIAKALSEAQKDIQNAHKDKKNPFYKSSYADLASTWDACRGPLTKNGLSIVQTTASINDDHYIEMRLMHLSGQWVESRLKLVLAKRDMQGLGSAITYARRYLLQSMVGVAPADDDGNSSVAKGNSATAMPKATESKVSPKETNEKAEVEPEPEQEETSNTEPSKAVSKDKAKELVQKAKKNGYTQDEVLEIIAFLGYSMVIDISGQDYETVMEEISKSAASYREKKVLLAKEAKESKSA